MKGSGNPQFDLCLEVLRRFDRAGILEDLVLVGSWCTFFYNRHFEGKAKLSALRTRDMDFLMSRPPRFKTRIEMSDLLKDLGFLPDLATNGSVSMVHPDLIIDFLVPERGKGSGETIPIPALGIRAQPLRFLEYLLRETIVVNHKGLDVRLPHPARFALHKLIVSGRRQKQDKAEKDSFQALELLDVLLALDRQPEIQERLDEMPPGWRKLVFKALQAADRPDLGALLKP